MITLRGQISVSRTDDDPFPSVCGFKTSPCVDSKRLRVCCHHAHMLKHMYAWCRHTRGRFECTHGGVFESTHMGFFHVFSACRNTHKHTPNTPRPPNNTTTTTTHTTQHNTQHHTETERKRERERQRDRERETREDGTRQEDKRR